MPLSTVLKRPPSPKLHRATSDHPKTTETSGPLNTDSSQSGGFDITNLLSSHPLTAVGTMHAEVLNPPGILLPVSVHTMYNVPILKCAVPQQQVTCSCV